MSDLGLPCLYIGFGLLGIRVFPARAGIRYLSKAFCGKGQMMTYALATNKREHFG